MPRLPVSGRNLDLLLQQHFIIRDPEDAPKILAEEIPFTHLMNRIVCLHQGYGLATQHHATHEFQGLERIGFQWLTGLTQMGFQSFRIPAIQPQ